MLPFHGRRKRLETSQRAESERPCNHRKGTGSREVDRSQGQKIGAGDWCPMGHRELRGPAGTQPTSLRTNLGFVACKEGEKL